MHDTIITNGHVIDPKNGIDGARTICITDGKIAKVADPAEPVEGKTVIDAAGKIITPGLIDFHVHTFEHLSAYSLNADRVGVYSGCTTINNLGNAGALTLFGFRKYVIERSITDVRVFPTIFAFGTHENWAPRSPEIGAGSVGDSSTRELIKVMEKHRDVAIGVKVHMDPGGISWWGFSMLDQGLKVGEALKVPMYVHTGALFPYKEGAPRMDPDAIIPEALSKLRPGDVLGHIFSQHPGAFLTREGKLNPAIKPARDKGLFFEIGHGSNFSFDVARKVMDEGVLPDLISSDVHGVGGFTPSTLVNDSRLDWSMVGTMTKMWGLGVSLSDVVAMSTIKPATALGLAGSKGTLDVGRSADITILSLREGEYVMKDSLRVTIPVKKKLLPHITVLGGRIYHLDPMSMQEFKGELALA